MTTSSVQALFHPEHIAVIGVSRDASSVGSTIYQNICDGSFRGHVYPVNPFIQEYRNVRCYGSVLSIPERIDVAIIVVPAPIVASVLEEVGKKGIPTSIIISSGFSETGAEGTQKELQIQAIGKKYSIALLGPNCLGVINPNDHLNASFARTKPLEGTIALLSQSGALGTGLLDVMTPKRIGFSHFISMGNKAGINELDILEYLATDPKTTCIGMYIEQLRDARSFIDMGRKLATLDCPKPIIVLKGGRTKEGTQAVHSHTGSLAGEFEAYAALFRQAGMIYTESTQEFLNTLVCFSQNPLPKGNACAIITNAGGPAILATDILVSKNVLMPSVSGTHNPLDLLGDAKARDFQTALASLEANDAIHSILGIVTPQAVTEIEDTANAFCIHKTTSTKPLAISWMGEDVMKNGRTILDMGHIPVSTYPEQTALMLSHLHEFLRFQKNISLNPTDDLLKTHPTVVPIDGQNPLELLKTYGIPVAPYVSIDSQSLERIQLHTLQDTVAIKIISKNIVHKSDIGAVCLNVPKNMAVQKAKDMIHALYAKIPDATISSVLFMDMIEMQQGLECIVGVKKEAGLGTLIVFGLGGIFVELLKDVSMRFAPLRPSDTIDMIEELRTIAVFNGFRRSAPLDKEAGAQTLRAISRLVTDHPEITELDINPLVVFPKGKGVIALDCRVTVSNETK